jgi:hypothetical protein
LVNPSGTPLDERVFSFVERTMRHRSKLPAKPRKLRGIGLNRSSNLWSLKVGHYLPPATSMKVPVE